MRRLGFSTIALAAASCAPPTFTCDTPEDCVTAGSAGVCEPDGHCSFEDPSCGSGRRYGKYGGELANVCVMATDDEGSSSSTGTTASTGTTSSTTAIPSTTAGTTTTSSEADSSSTAGPLPEPLLWFDFEDALGDGFDNGGSLGGAAACVAKNCPSAVPGRVGLAAAFDGIDDCAQFEWVPELNTLSAFSVAAWIRVAGVDGSYEAIMAKPVGDGAYNTWRTAVQAFDGANTLHVHVGLADNTGAELNPPLASTDWVHFAATWDTETLTLWVDGAVLDSIAAPLIAWDEQAVFIGCDDDHTQIVGYFPGAIDDLRLYDRVLEQDEIVSLAGP